VSGADLGLELAADRARRAGVELTADQLVVAAVFDSGEHAQDPAALARAFAVGRVDPVVLSVVLPWVWRYKLDACTLPVGAWREMFAAVPYAVNGRATDRTSADGGHMSGVTGESVQVRGSRPSRKGQPV
jgi:hypothetical protein